jgi:hypothetical protein
VAAGDATTAVAEDGTGGAADAAPVAVVDETDDCVATGGAAGTGCWGADGMVGDAAADDEDCVADGAAWVGTGACAGASVDAWGGPVTDARGGSKPSGST